MPERFLSMRQVLKRVPLSRVSIYNLIKSGEFPEQIPITPSRVAWIESEIDQWIDERIGAARGTADVEG